MVAAPPIICWACGATAGPTDEFLPARLARCSSCGFLFQPDRATDEIRSLYGDEYFAEYPSGTGGTESYVARERERFFEADVRLRLVERAAAGGRLLEVGCAAGYFLAVAARAGFEVVGVEPSPAEAERARERFGVDVRTGFLEDMEFPAGFFDVACAWHVVEHLGDPVAALEQLRRMLTPSAPLVLEVPNAASVRARREGRSWGWLDLEHHVGHYTPDAMRALLLRSGFEVEVIETVSPAVYRRWPRRLVSHARQASILRGSPFGADPWRHGLLRAIALVPS